jgi:hypothetical protein
MDLRGYNSRTEWELLQGWQGFSALARGPQVFLHLEVEPATPQSTPRLPTARPCQLITPLLAPCKKEAMSSAAAQLVAYARPLLRQDGRDQEAVDSRRQRHGDDTTTTNIAIISTIIITPTSPTPPTTTTTSITSSVTRR